ncbi:MAG: hypothetical protein ACM336_07370 [Acidobacteriota bacterium]
MLSPEESPISRLAGRSLPLVAVLLVCATAASVVYAIRERGNARELAASRDEMTAALAQTRAQVDQLSAKMTQLVTERQQAAAPAEAPAVAPRVRRSPAPVRVPPRRRADDPRFKQIQDQLSEHQKQLAGAQEELKRSREEMEGKLDSTRTELSGSIARNHDELVELQKRGERNYYEFELSKSKQFQRTGPISLSLRKADTKHKRFNLVLLVDDMQLEKKNVNVYEPVQIYLPDRPQPFELVINQVTKNQVKGYLSEPKYKKSELASAATETKPAEPGGLRQR